MITKNMEKVAAFVFLALAQGVNAEDDFNYRRTEGRDYGPADWDEVSCNNLKTCVSLALSDLRAQYWGFAHHS